MDVTGGSVKQHCEGFTGWFSMDFTCPTPPPGEPTFTTVQAAEVTALVGILLIVLIAALLLFAVTTSLTER